MKVFRKLLELKEVKYLSEIMNFPGVIFDNAEVIKKLNCAKELNKPIYGHASCIRIIRENVEEICSSRYNYRS
jgi:adenine deaminase